MKKTLSLLQLALSFMVLEGANILVVLPIPWYSHTNTFMPIFKELRLRGHNITMVSPFPQSEPLQNWTDLTVDATPFKGVVYELVHSTIGLNQYMFYPVFLRIFTDLMEVAFQDNAIRYLINAEALNYDAIIIEPFYAQEPLIALAHKLNVPVIGVHALSLTPWGAFLTGNELSFHLLPNIRSSYTNDMSFFERIDNCIVNLIEFSVAYSYYLPNKEKQMNKYVVYPGSDNRPSLLTMLRNVSLTLIDYHSSILYAEPLQPNTIPIGGLSLLSIKELPKDLKDIIDQSKKGVIFLSFGSILQGSELADTILKSLMEAFSHVEQTVIMKWQFEEIPNKPKNVVVRKWLPQPSILAHPNVQLFITHAGLHGITEGAYFGIPVLCIPLFSDQPYDAKFVEKVGYGVTLLLKDLTKESLLISIKEVLENPRYKEVAKERSNLLKDRPQKSLQDAVYWVEHVLKHKGARHLKPARTELSLFAILGLDIIMFILLVSLSLSFVIHKFCIKPIYKIKIKKKQD